MVISIPGRPPNESNSEFCHLWEIFAKILRVMASEVDLFIIFPIMSFYRVANEHAYWNSISFVIFSFEIYVFVILTGSDR
jgi:hypothetical protein